MRCIDPTRSIRPNSHRRPHCSFASRMRRLCIDYALCKVHSTHRYSLSASGIVDRRGPGSLTVRCCNSTCWAMREVNLYELPVASVVDCGIVGSKKRRLVVRASPGTEAAAVVVCTSVVVVLEYRSAAVVVCCSWTIVALDSCPDRASYMCASAPGCL